MSLSSSQQLPTEPHARAACRGRPTRPMLACSCAWAAPHAAHQQACRATAMPVRRSACPATTPIRQPVRRRRSAWGSAKAAPAAPMHACREFLAARPGLRQQRSMCQATASPHPPPPPPPSPSAQHTSAPHPPSAPSAVQFQDGVFGQVSLERGFLPLGDPPGRLTLPGTQAWEDALAEVPKLVVAGGDNGLLRRMLASLPPFPTQSVLPAGAQGAAEDRGDDSSASLWRSYYLLSFLSHAYMWCESGPTPQSLPAVLAQPWTSVSHALDMPPVLVYASYNMLNWRRLDRTRPVELGNIVCLQNFMCSLDEEWFRLVHVAIEADAARAIAVLRPMILAAQQGDEATVLSSLTLVTQVLQSVQRTLARMGEKCDPYVYYARVRQPMSGWRNNPLLPSGLLYEGCSAPDGGPLRLQLYGETGAQSSVVPALDTALGIEHKQDWLKSYLVDMRAHMPPAHRAYLMDLEQLSHGSHETHDSTQSHGSHASAPGGACSVVRHMCMQPGRGELRDAYNEAVTELEKFRAQHKALAYNYIAKWSQKQQQEEKGTGGSDFMPALKGYQDTTSQHVLPITKA